MLNIYIVRHGQTQYNLEGRFQGWKNSPLTEKGKEDLDKLAQRLKNVDFDAIYSSPSGRAMETTEILKGDRALSIIKDDDFREMNLGDWEGQYLQVLKEQFTENFDNFWNRPDLFVSPGGESYDNLLQRVQRGFDRIIRENTQGNVLLVSHGVWIKSLFVFLEKADLQQLWSGPPNHGASLSIVNYDGKAYHIIKKMDIEHLDSDTLPVF